MPVSGAGESSTSLSNHQINNDKKSTPVMLVGVDFGFPHFDSELEELGLLAQTAGLDPVARLTCKRKVPDAALFVGSGKADEIRMVAQTYGAKEVLFDQALSPAQQRNLERSLQMPVNDRTLLILEIFAQRARSHEGKLQVELAKLQYLSTRLVRRWSHLERQRGGIGTRGGPGETQIELDRRMINDAIKRTKERLSKVKKQRATQRRQRERNDTFNVSLVGYTNAGKSTFFNAVVKARAYAADQLFATLDTTTRQMYLESAQKSVSISDTVGFIRDLPHGLVNAFEATLQEAVDADLLLHVVDASNPAHPEQIQQVQKVLREIGAEDVPQVLIFNKLDAMDPVQRPTVLADSYELDGVQVPRFFVSAAKGAGLDVVRAHLAEAVLAHRAALEARDADEIAPDADDELLGNAH
ncbi:GTP-binding protein HflX [Comamonas odontotermitis]|uniref:GTPase HflX n=2 Tax=Comamonas odontotermitis TaxID=379895 RepID=A0ABR6RL27_9BURK|nr:GTP-binding protein HflX [Comamonas odontotermitis]